MESFGRTVVTPLYILYLTCNMGTPHQKPQEQGLSVCPLTSNWWEYSP